MAITQTQLDALEQAIVAGELTVRYSDGQSVTYHSKQELIDAFNWAQNRFNAQTSSNPRVPRHQLANFGD